MNMNIARTFVSYNTLHPPERGPMMIYGVCSKILGTVYFGVPDSGIGPGTGTDDDIDIGNRSIYT